MSNVIALHTQVRGLYKIEAVRPDGSRRLLADWFPNLITTNGLNLIGAGGNWLSYCCVGSGNTAPSNSDTTLVSLIGSTSNQFSVSQAATSSSPYYGYTSIVYRFAAGVATGNLAEVGVGGSTGGSNLFSRALILDGVGTPTTITVLSTEALDVTYQIQMYSPTVDVTGSVVIGGVTYNYTLRAANVTTTSWAPIQYGDVGGFQTQTAGQGTIGAVTTVPSYSATAGPDSTANGTYGTGNFYNDTTFVYGLTSGNVAGGINCFTLQGGRSYGRLGWFQCQLNASIPKDASHTLSVTFRHSWGRYP